MTTESHQERPLPTLMRAIGYSKNTAIDDAEALVEREVPLPKIGPHDLLVEVHAVSVNPVDVKQRAHAGSGGFRVLGYDAAGVVVAAGSSVTLFEPGDHVYYAGALNRPGSNAHYQAVDERIVGRKPASLDWADAAALPLTTLTAYEALFDKLHLTETSEGTLLIVGAAGGVGSIMIQLVKVLAPRVRVIGTASRPESQQWVRSLGADAVVDHGGDLAAHVLEAAPDGVDWIFTSASAKPGAVASYVRIAKPFGQIVAIDARPPRRGSAERQSALLALGVHVRPLDASQRRSDRTAPHPEPRRRTRRRGAHPHHGDRATVSAGCRAADRGAPHRRVGAGHRKGRDRPRLTRSSASHPTLTTHTSL
ncbi:hypothetical protein GCM10009851_11520 [Herbiconiux moechotypicola]|uniref:Zinc-type alcohol dehydrogenase-like protein n=1 Tax=Herbiconiux moechotypicola TaxID=637393 RepID=A0ABN3DEF9_9MICO